MPDGDGAERRDVAGMPVEDAVETVVDADNGVDRATARAALTHVATDDGLVSPAAAEAALGETTMVVSTPETRAELAAIALADAREAAPVEDLGIVTTRFEAFESRLAAIRSRIEALGADLRALVEWDVEEADLFSIGRGIRQVRSEADDLQHAADELQVDLEEFEEWLGDPSVRAEDLRTDVETIADSLSGREATLDSIAADIEESDGAEDGALSSDDPGRTWAEAAVGHRVSGLLLIDVRAELADVRTMAGQQDGGHGDSSKEADDARLDEIEARVADLEERRGAIGERLDGLARPAWRDRFDDRLAAVEGVLADAEPPVAWGELQVAIDEARA